MPDTQFRDRKAFNDSGLHIQTAELVKDKTVEDMMVLIDKYCRADKLLACMNQFGFFPHKKTIEWYIEDQFVRYMLLDE
jgi:hypothetical protein